MDYNRLLKENDSLSETNIALKRRIFELETEIQWLKGELYSMQVHTGRQQASAKASTPYFDGINGNHATPAFCYSPKTEGAKP